MYGTLVETCSQFHYTEVCILQNKNIQGKYGQLGRIYFDIKFEYLFPI